LGDDPSACGAGGISGTRAEGEREGEDDQGSEGINELSGKILKTLVFLVGDLLGAKNASATSQGLFACFNVGKHNAQEIRAHRQHVDEQLIKLETRQKALLAQHNIEHSPVREPMDFPPPPTFYNPWEIYGDTSMMYGAPPTDIDDEDFGGGETDDDDSPPAAHSPDDNDD
jgi:hypothetical protein